MTAKELFTYLTQDAGFDDATAQVLMKAAENEKVGARAAALKQQAEFDAIEAKRAQLEVSYQKAKTYEDWYAKNYTALTNLQTKTQLYEERYGPLDNPSAQPAAAAATFDQKKIEEMIQAGVDARIQGVYGEKWSSLLKGSGRLIEKHFRSGRKKDIDWDKVSEIAAAKGGDLMAAYDEWDKPDAEAALKDTQEKEIERRVKERLAKERTAANFPAGADAGGGSGGLSRGITRDAAPKTYDRNKVIEAAVSGKYAPDVVQ